MFEWDEAKSQANWRRRGFDFAYAIRIFEGLILEKDDERFDYGERRILAIGRVGTDTLVVVYTWRGELRRIISARLANRKERNAYGKILS